MDKVMAIIPAAGSGKRMGAGVDKRLLSLCGRAVLEYAVGALSRARCIDGIILVVRPGEEDFFRGWSGSFANAIVAVVSGGGERQESVRKGLKALPADTGIVVVHDGARPLVEPRLVERVVETARSGGAAILGVPVKDTAKLARADNKVIKTVPRENLWLVQTPQAFRYDLLCEAHQRALEKGLRATDDASLVEDCGYDVIMEKGSYANIKVTTPEDVTVAEAFLKAGVNPWGKYL